MAEVLPIRNGGHKGLKTGRPLYLEAPQGPAWFQYLFLFVLSRFICVQLFATVWTGAHQAPLFMRFSRQEYWSELPFPVPGYLPDPVIEPVSPVSPALAGRFFTPAPPGKPFIWYDSNHSLPSEIFDICFSLP